MPAKEGTARRRQATSGWVPGLGLGVHFKGQGLGGGGDGLAEQCWGSGPWSQLIQHQSTGRSSSVEGVGEGGGGGAPDLGVLQPPPLLLLRSVCLNMFSSALQPPRQARC